MSNPVERVADWVDALVHGRRPPRFAADREEAPALLAAAALKSARPGEDLPSPEFVEGLRRRLAEQLEPAPRPRAGGLFSRRRLLEVTGFSAAAAVAGAIFSRAVETPDTPLPKHQQLEPDNAQWVAVMAASAVPPGTAARFTAGAVEGFIVNREGAIEALSAVCTHMGCILKFNATAARFDCPCHGATFALDGSPGRGYLDSLPRIAARVTAGKVEVSVATA